MIVSSAWSRSGQYGSTMERVSDLAEVDLPAVLALDLTEAAVTELVDVGHHVDQLRAAGDEPGWAVGTPPLPVITGHPIPRHMMPKIPESVALGTVLDQPLDHPKDLLEYALDVWHDGEGALLVTAAVEVGCFCPQPHESHAAAESAWTATGESDLLTALDQAVAELAGWVKEAAGPDEWRRRADLPAR